VKNAFGVNLILYALNVNFMHKARRPIMRTTLDLPEDLINEAMKATHINTKTKVIITALEDLIRKSKISGLKQFKGKIDLDIDMNAIRGR
jgi:hypothetical protein